MPFGSLFQKPPLYVLRGRTGSGKTAVLNALANGGCQTLDLEYLAHHRGSVFGALGMPEQPSQGQFLHRLQVHWTVFNPTLPLFIEYPGAYLGSIAIPPKLCQQIEQADWIQLKAGSRQRISTIVASYPGVGQQWLLAATKRLQGRLDAASLAQIRQAIRRQQYQQAVRLLLPYYDAAYDHQMTLAAGECLLTIKVDRYSPQQVADAILKQVDRTGPHDATD